MVSVYPIVLFGGGQVNVDLQHGEFIITLDDGWIRFSAASHEVFFSFSFFQHNDSGLFY